LIIVPLKGWNSSNIWEIIKESKLNSGRIEVQIEVTECLLPLGAECFVFQFAIQEYKD
jgi:hypothetical protein